MKTLKIKNYFLIGNEASGIRSLQSWLMNLMLHGSDSRCRTRFIKFLSDRMNEIDKELEKMRNEYAEKNAEGKIIYIDLENKEYDEPAPGRIIKFSKENQEKLEAEFQKYINEELVIDISPSNSETVYAVRNLVLNTQSEFSGLMATRYDEWCQAFEDIKKEEA